MGAWGSGNFENDAARDWLGDLGELNNPAMVRKTLEAIVRATEKAYLKNNKCCAALAAAEVVATAAGRPGEYTPEKATAWARANAANLVDLVSIARAAVERIESGSELQELFDEGGRDEEWHAVVQRLIARL
jgi:hypothetical protein